MNVIETKKLTCRYGRMEAVHDLDLSVPAGCILALLGPNGAGKTSTIKMLMNLQAPSSGKAWVLGVDARRLGVKERTRIGYVTENMQLPSWMTVQQLLDYCRPLYPKWDTELVNKLLKLLALPLERRLVQLSRGMKMKAQLLTALAYRPALLVLDEPFSGLDALVRDELIHSLLEGATAGETTILISSHDIAEVERLCDRVVLLDSGQLQLDEATEKLQARFRKIELNLPASDRAKNNTPFPPNWLDYEEAGSRAGFIETQYDAEKTALACVERFGPGATPLVQALPLRDIFVVLARANRATKKGVAA
jgi:ABC-2 type transport system ATP-binding protein